MDIWNEFPEEVMEADTMLKKCLHRYLDMKEQRDMGQMWECGISIVRLHGCYG